MKSSREQFEEWFKSEHEEVDNSQELAAKVMKMIAWSAWQASRSAIEIELTDWVSFGARAAIDYDDTVSSLRNHGLKVKVAE